MAAVDRAAGSGVPARDMPPRRPHYTAPPPRAGGSSPRSPRGRGGPGTGRASAPPRRVLIVEDEALVALALEAMVQDAGHIVVGVATNAAAGVALAVDLAPEVVLMDIRLGPAGDAGIAAAGAIRGRTAAAVIFVTAHATAAIMGRIGSAVPSAKVLAKPGDATELAEAIAGT
jgi:two-component system, response regulator PdtaR